MTKIKLCGLSRICDIDAANKLMPEYIGFVFAQNSRRFVSPEQAEKLKKHLDPKIKAVGVFVNEAPENIVNLLNKDIIDAAQLHGNEDEDYIRALKLLTDKMIIKAFKIKGDNDVSEICRSFADFVLLDSGAGTGSVFDWSLIKGVKRPYFLAGGLGCGNIKAALEALAPYAVDVSSGIETDGFKDERKMTEFVNTVRGHKVRERKSEDEQ